MNKKFATRYWKPSADREKLGFRYLIPKSPCIFCSLWKEISPTSNRDVPGWGPFENNSAKSGALNPDATFRRIRQPSTGLKVAPPLAVTPSKVSVNCLSIG